MGTVRLKVRGVAERPFTEAEMANLRALRALLDVEDPTDLLLAAELARVTGDFVGAAALLEGPLPDGVEDQAAALLSLVRSGTREVREIWRDDRQR